MNIKICDCKFYKRCHNVRQKLQLSIRKDHPGRSICDCIFYKELEEIEDKKNTNHGKKDRTPI